MCLCGRWAGGVSGMEEEKRNEWCFRLWFCTLKLCWAAGQSRLVRWILLWIMPLVQGRSLDLLTSSKACYHCTMDAPRGRKEVWVEGVQGERGQMEGGGMRGRGQGNGWSLQASRPSGSMYQQCTWPCLITDHVLLGSWGNKTQLLHSRPAVYSWRGTAIGQNSMECKVNHNRHRKGTLIKGNIRHAIFLTVAAFQHPFYFPSHQPWIYRVWTHFILSPTL